MNLNVLLIDDDEIIRELFCQIIKKEGHQVFTVSSGEEGVSLLRKKEFDLIITDMRLPGISGHEILEQAKNLCPEAEVVVITGYGDIETAVEIMKAGAYDFWLKPIYADTLREKIKKISEKKALEKAHKDLKRKYEELSLQIGQNYYDLIGQSDSMKKIFSLIHTIKDLDSTVLISGETGTGKELVARAIHMSSKRKDKPFVIVDAGAIPETLMESELFGYEKGAFTSALRQKTGRFERAHTGTLFLDEINNTSLGVQQKLLRMIQERSFERLGGETPRCVNVRIIAATNQDLSESVQKGSFRKDLFYRLNVISISIPPLRERKEDLLPIARHFLEMFQKQMGKGPLELTPNCIKQIMGYSWPGNVRELRNFLERAVAIASGPNIDYLDIPENPYADNYANVQVDTSQSLQDVVNKTIHAVEKIYLTEMLNTYQGKLNYIAEKSQISQKTLYRKMQEYGLAKEDFKKGFTQ